MEPTLVGVGTIELNPEDRRPVESGGNPEDTRPVERGGKPEDSRPADRGGSGALAESSETPSLFSMSSARGMSAETLRCPPSGPQAGTGMPPEEVRRSPEKGVRMLSFDGTFIRVRSWWMAPEMETGEGWSLWLLLAKLSYGLWLAVKGREGGTDEGQMMPIAELARRGMYMRAISGHIRGSSPVSIRLKSWFLACTLCMCAAK
mmetsp:Transcript_323/g.858  ORF Transcript_323/g.858 Transcript_323/m.858 type:complete len:204 (-) Transcript_323:430-1041(-)